MSFSTKRLDPRTRLLTLANLALAVGLMLWTFVHPSGQMAKDAIHALSGFLLGLSLTINLLGWRRARRC